MTSKSSMSLTSCATFIPMLYSNECQALYWNKNHYDFIDSKVNWNLRMMADDIRLMANIETKLPEKEVPLGPEKQITEPDEKNSSPITRIEPKPESTKP